MSKDDTTKGGKRGKKRIARVTTRKLIKPRGEIFPGRVPDVLSSLYPGIPRSESPVRLATMLKIAEYNNVTMYPLGNSRVVWRWIDDQQGPEKQIEGLGIPANQLGPVERAAYERKAQERLREYSQKYAMEIIVAFRVSTHEVFYFEWIVEGRSVPPGPWKPETYGPEEFLEQWYRLIQVPRLLLTGVGSPL